MLKDDLIEIEQVISYNQEQINKLNQDIGPDVDEEVSVQSIVEPVPGANKELSAQNIAEPVAGGSKKVDNRKEASNKEKDGDMDAS
jgi:hypothetical protein